MLGKKMGFRFQTGGPTGTNTQRHKVSYTLGKKEEVLKSVGPKSELEKS